MWTAWLYRFYFKAARLIADNVGYVVSFTDLFITELDQDKGQTDAQSATHNAAFCGEGLIIISRYFV